MISTVLHLAAVLLAALAVGTTAHILISVHTERNGRLHPPPQLATIARVTTLAWCAVALGTAVTVDSAMGNGPRVAWFGSALAAGAFAVITWIATTWQVRFIGLALGCLGAAAPATVGTFAQGPGQDRTGVLALVLAVALPILCGSAVAYLLRFRTGAPEQQPSATVLRTIVRRHTVLSWLCLGALGYAVIGIVVSTLRDGWTDTWGTLSILSLAALAVGVLATLRLRGAVQHDAANSTDQAAANSTAPYRNSFPVPRIPVLAQVGSMLILAVSTTIMAHSDAPSAETSSSVQQEMIGFDVPGEWTWLQLVANWRADLLFGPLAVALAVFYLLGVRRLRARGDTWPTGRIIAWITGCVSIVLITCTGINRYAHGQFTVHMILHMGLNLFIPALLVMGGAVTLAMRALPARSHHDRATDGVRLPGVRECLLLLVHSRVTRFFGHPIIAITIYTVSLYGLYFTPLFEWALRAPWGHEWMIAHFILTGYLFYWPVVGIDPGPSRLPHLGKLGMLLAIMPFHAFFGIILMSMSGSVADAFYTELGILGSDLITHQQTLAGGIAWASGEIPLLIVFLALATQWERSDRRQASRQDRHAEIYGDDELEAYNRMLRELQEQRR